MQPNEQKAFDKIYSLMPELVNEFIEDLKENPVHREFILFRRNWVYNSGGKQILVYYFDDHEDLDNKIRILEIYGFVEDITYNNTKRYIFKEKLVDILLNK